MSKITVVPLSSAKEEVQSLAKRGFVLWITGQSGSGKDYVAAKVATNSRKWCLLDDFGEERKGKWVIKVPHGIIDSSVVFVGHSDNMTDLSEQIIERSKGKLCYVVVTAGPSVFKAASAAKAAEAPEMGLPKSWVDYWAQRSKWSNAQILANNKEKVAYYFKVITEAWGKHTLEYNELVLMHVTNDVSSGDITRGWHFHDLEKFPLPANRTSHSPEFKKKKEVPDEK